MIDTLDACGALIRAWLSRIGLGRFSIGKASALATGWQESRRDSSDAMLSFEDVEDDFRAWSHERDHSKQIQKLGCRTVG